jgi:hypothetical protein
MAKLGAPTRLFTTKRAFTNAENTMSLLILPNADANNVKLRLDLTPEKMDCARTVFARTRLLFISTRSGLPWKR